MPEESKKEKGKYFRILSIDGGGIRGIIPASVLVEVEKAIQSKYGDNSLHIGDCFDLIAGTSTGGILTCIYLAPDKNDPKKARFSAYEGLNLYMENGDEIFDRTVWQKLSSLGGLSDEKYSSEMLEKVLKRYLGELELKQLIKPCLITAYSTKQYRPFFFTQHDAIANETCNYLVRNVARATSAAPTYFEAALAENLDDIPNAVPMIDGGVFANNPTACALVEAFKLNSEPNIDNTVILSLGTGVKTKSITYNECKNFGLAGWARPLIDILMEGVSQTVDYQMLKVFESLNVSEQYLRINGEFDDIKSNLQIDGLETGLDNASVKNMKLLERFGRQLALNNKAKIEQFVKKYC